MSEDEKPPQEYARFDNDAGLQEAIERLLDIPGRELRIFDPDLASLRLNLPGRTASLLRFLQASRTRRIYIATHDTTFLTRHAPRFMNLYARYTHAIAIHRTHDGIRELKDSFMVLDASHYVRRAVARYYRGAIGLHDDVEAYAMRARFLEIWAASYPAPMLKTLGL